MSEHDSSTLIYSKIHEKKLLKIRSKKSMCINVARSLIHQAKNNADNFNHTYSADSVDVNSW